MIGLFSARLSFTGLAKATEPIAILERCRLQMKSVTSAMGKKVMKL